MSLIKSSDAPASRNWLSNFFDNDSFFNDNFFSRTNIPSVNVKENERLYTIEMAVPGFKKEEFNLRVENGILFISGENKSEKEEKNENYTRKEFNYSTFSRSFSLPENANQDKIEAKYENGLLKLEILKKSSPENKKQISVM